MCRSEDPELRTGREDLVRHCIRLLDDGLAIGTAGNLSLRLGETVLITPSGVGYHDLGPADMCAVSLNTADPARPSAQPASRPSAQLTTGLTTGPDEPATWATASSELPLHLAVYAATDATAVVHTHSPEVVALSAVRDELPAIHYAITALGGPVRVAAYERFGSVRLAQAAVTALAGRQAVILRNHGAVTYGTGLAQAYERALLLEWLARVYRMACSLGEPRTLTAAQLDEVAAEGRRRGYGQARGRGEAGDRRDGR